MKTMTLYENLLRQNSREAVLKALRDFKRKQKNINHKGARRNENKT